MLWLFLLYFALPKSISQCLIMPLDPLQSCHTCLFNYFEVNYPSYMKLTSTNGFSLSPTDCSLKNNSFSSSRKILILNSNITTSVFNGFDRIYNDSIQAFQEESKISNIYLYSSIEFNFYSGNHYLLRSSVLIGEEELFRRELVTIMMKPLNDGDSVNLIFKTNEFYLFISKNLTIKNIQFLGNDILFQNNNDPLACYNNPNNNCCYLSNFSTNYPNNNSVSCSLQNRKILNYQKSVFYGLFNLEYMFDNSNFNDFPNILLYNCSFINFFPLNLTQGWNSLLTLSPLAGFLTVDSSYFENNYFPNGLIYYNHDKYDNLYAILINYRDFLSYETNYQKVSITNSIFNNFNQYLIDSSLIGGVSLMKIIQYKGNLQMENDTFMHFSNLSYILYLENSQNSFSSILLNNLNFFNMSYIGAIYINNYNSLTLENLNFSSISNNLINIINLKNINNFTINQIFLNNIINPTIISINVINSIGIIQNSCFQLSKQLTLLYINGGNTFIINCTFYNLTFVNNILSLIGQNSPYLSSCIFSFINGSVSMFYISATSNFTMLKTIIKYVAAYSIYYLENMNLNYNNDIYMSFNTLTYVWKNDHTCLLTKLENSSLINNSISISMFANLGIPNVSIFCYLVRIINNVMSVRPIIKILYGICNLTNVTVIYNIYPNPSNLHYVFSFESYNQVYIMNSFFKDNGAITRKIVYLAAYESALINLWSLTYSYLSTNVFVSSSTTELGSGFISSSPHGGVFILYNSTFIILDINPNFRYKGVLLDHFTQAIMIGNTFINLKCNDLSFIHMHGSVSLVAASSYSYSQNNYVVYMENNHFFNCSCINGGGLGVISIYNVTIRNCNFYNSSASRFSGHLLIISGIYLSISKILFNISRSDEGAGAYIRNFLSADLENIEVYDAYSRKNGVFFFRDIDILQINSIYAKNIYSLMNGGMMYVFNSETSIQNLTIYNSHAEIEGGSLMIAGNSKLTLLNCFINTSSAYMGGCLSIESATIVFLSNLTANNIFSNLTGAGIYVTSLKSLNLFDIFITNGTCQGNGIISLITDDENVPLNLNNIVCINTIAVRGSCIFYLSSSKFNINDLSITNNGPSPIYIMWSYEVIVYLTNISISNSVSSDFLLIFSGVKFYLNTSEINGNTALKNLFDLQEAEGYINDLNFQNNLGENAFNLMNTILFVTNLYLNNDDNQIYYLNLLNGDVSDIYFTNSLINKIHSKRNSHILFSGGNLNFYNVNFMNNIGNLFDLLSVNIILNFCQFFNNTSLDLIKPNDLNFDSNDNNNIYNINIFSCNFSIYSGFSINLIGGLIVEISNSYFTNFENTMVKGIYSIYSENFKRINITSTYFYQFTASALQFYSNQYSIFEFSEVFINSSEFNNISSILGSALYFKGIFHILVNSSQFISNKAVLAIPDKSNPLNMVQGIASCIFFRSENQLNSTIDLSYNIFLNNNAEYLGSTIFSQNYLQIQHNIFINNTDKINFTTQAFAYPLHLVQKLDDNDSNSFIEIASGNSFAIVFLIQDDFNQTLIFDNSTIFTLKQKISSSTEQQLQQILLQNELSQAKNGEVSFQNLIIKTTPNSTFQLELSGIFMGIPNNRNDEINNIELKLDLNFFSRPCEIGEVITQDLSCDKCLPGKYSFIDPMITEMKYQKCNECPLNCECIGGYYVTPDPGYYRKSNISDNVVACTDKYACLGNTNITNISNRDDIIHGGCLYGNEGVLCFYCSFNYGKYDKTEYCKECASLGMTVIVRLIFYGILMVIYILLNFHMAEQTHKQQGGLNLGTIFKVIINHSQHINIILLSSTQIPFPSFMNFFNQNDYFSFSNDQVITNDCLVQRVYFDPQTNVIFKEIFNTVLPIAFSLLAFLIWIVLNCFLGCSSRFKNNLKKIPKTIAGILSKTTIFVVLSTFIFYSLIVKSCFGLFDCIVLDENDPNKFLRDSPAIQCWSAAHVEYVIFFGLPGLIIWGIIFPLFLFYVLNKNLNFMTMAQKSGMDQLISVNFDCLEKKDGKISIDNKISKDHSIRSQALESFFGNTDKGKLNSNIKQSNESDQKIQSFVSGLHKTKQVKTFKSDNEKMKFFDNYKQNLEYSKTFVFFYKDYKSKYFYWECLIFFRKFILTFFSVLSNTMNNEIRLIIMLSIICIFLLSTYRNLPYKFKGCNHLELMSMSICMIAIFSSSVFASSSPMNFQYAVGVICILSNMCFFIAAAFMVYLEFRVFFKNFDIVNYFPSIKKNIKKTTKIILIGKKSNPKEKAENTVKHKAEN